jgi:glc operon protein GlcG
MKAVPSFKLTQEGADIIVNAAVEKAKELKQIVSIAVVDSGGHLFSFKRMTNGRTHNTMIALAKARSAALTTAATGKTNREGGEIPDHQVLAQTLAVGPGWFISIEGGIPLTIEGQCIAGIGVSGAPAAVDKQICQAGVDAFNKAG